MQCTFSYEIEFFLARRIPTATSCTSCPQSAGIFRALIERKLTCLPTMLILVCTNKAKRDKGQCCMLTPGRNGKSSGLLVDLHGLHVKEAIAMLEEQIEGVRRSKPKTSRPLPQRLSVLVGTGHHTKVSLPQSNAASCSEIPGIACCMVCCINLSNQA